MRTLKTCLLALVAGGSLALAAAEVGAPVEVAPKAEGSRAQRLPAAAWAEESKMWLVVWREGFLNEPEKGTDIWCARVAADGKALDSAGIKIANGKGLKDDPKVASDGKDFLVVWEDLSNGKDWDVRGARVSGAGKLLDEKGLLVAGGEHNQCHPAATFAADNYLVFWQGLTGTGNPGDKGTGYAIYSARVSKDGRLLDDKGVEVSPLGSSQSLWPVASARGEAVLVAHAGFNYNVWGGGAFGGKLVDPKTGQAKGSLQSGSKGDLRQDPFCEDVERQRFPAAAVGKDGILAAIDYNQPQAGLRVFNLDGAGSYKEMVIISPARVPGFPNRYAIAFDGERYLLVSDSCVAVDSRKGQPSRPEVKGWYFGADGKPVDDLKAGFVVSSNGKDQAEPAVAAGPKGVCLVAYVETRGVDDVKIMARLVK